MPLNMSKQKLVAVLLAVPVMALLSITVLWLIFYLGIYIGYGNYQVWGHQEFAVNGVSQIKYAKEMNKLFDDCRHYITYGTVETPNFTSVAYFGDRYELTMQVPVKIESASLGSVVGEPMFILNEIDSISVSPTGSVSASFSRNRQFGVDEWREVYDSQGDFSRIGFNINPTPVPNFSDYTAATRPSN
jgi:hypothetical protein